MSYMTLFDSFLYHDLLIIKLTRNRFGERYRELVNVNTTLRIFIIFIICVGFSFGISLNREV